MSNSTTERCVICLDEKREPINISCGHSFCKECFGIYKGYRKYNWGRKCPICRRELKPKKRDSKIGINSSLDSNPSSSAESLNNSMATNLLMEHFISIASNDTLNTSNASRDQIALDVTNPIPNSETDSMEIYDNDGDDFENYFSDSEEDGNDDDAIYGFEENLSWNEHFEEDINVEPEDSYIAHNESWYSTGSGQVDNFNASSDDSKIYLDLDNQT
ncbi:E3 ubiquitin-protein ligase rnf8-A-like [Musca domestica]|uniref:E3 ubiquitin-protein ligase rnf8-A-like n=1 Tax=Musca domestica TaxID=7370 RepID=A0A1I8M591_MUSDO|nr:E3 ubiquitin-protein ligase rnf8-A-like [Musca domestica]